MKSITYEGTNFNAEHLSKKTLAEFIEEFQNTPVYEGYSPADRLKLLTEAYGECRKAMGLPIEEAVVASPAIESTPGVEPAAEGNTTAPAADKAGKAGKKSEEK